ncbi:peptidoglycan-binding domain-containing protein [Hamadaea tsunoensis]|uniref:peptidoglycan-binding domain-containing protein n=1 Tax=Hamadaea tsunoensis TaxID=53368 RepID=UPI00048A3FE5|nr:peptidoglycan-binding protein [Hamadaea tsunoensis]
MRAGWLAGGGVLALAAAVTVIVLNTGGQHDPQATDHGGTTATVTRQDLADAKTVSGELAYGEAIPLVSRAAGTVTWLPAVGAAVDRGGALLRADDRPVTLLFGAMPAYRPLVVGTEGPDVKQFEENLKALGYKGFSVDDKFSASTATAVRRWQKDLGLAETGMVDPAAIVYAAGRLRVEELKVRPGAAATGEILTYTGTRKTVTVDVAADDHAWAVPGTAVTITLPGSIEVAGKIETVGAEASADPGQPGAGNATLPVTVTIADQAKLGSLAKTPVDVRYVAEERKNVLTVPVAALLALAEGGYGLEVHEASGTRIVAVQVGLFADGLVEVGGGGIAEGQIVGMPT